MGQALYRKYRSKSLAEIIGQEHITETLTQALKSGRISHAYLFTGPRGVGKTSIARILAHEINGLPYNHEDNHIDIIEIDAASNRGIDEIRDLREKVYMAPVSAKYKVYIIDEVHMLTTQAFNALLKTLEEPPEHVVFILATTEAHKLPETIISRTQRHIFRPVDQQKVVEHLRSIAKTEKLDIDDAALELFAAHGEGSFRDSISLLDQASGLGKVTADVAQTMLGVPPQEAIAALLAAVTDADSAQVIAQLESLSVQGFQATAVAKRLGATVRNEFLSQTGSLLATQQLTLMRSLIPVPAAADPTRLLEIVLFEAMPRTDAVRTVTAPPTPKPKDKPPVATSTPLAPKAPPKTPPEPAKSPIVEVADKIIPAEKEADTITATGEPLDPNTWPKVLDALKKQYNTLYGVMRMAVPEFEGDKLTLRFRFAFHQKRMNETKHRQIVIDIIKDITGQIPHIECVHDTAATLASEPIGAAEPAVPEPAVSMPSSSLSAISNIFGGGELLES